MSLPHCDNLNCQFAVRNLKLTTVVLILMHVVCVSRSSGQLPDFKSMTLDLRDVTAERVQQTLAESPNGNEKEVEFGDYDNDGDLDVVMAVGDNDFGQRRNKLYRNDDGVLVEVSGTSVMPEFALDDTSRSAFFRDFDQDGFLDIVIINEGNSGTAQTTSPGRTKYFRNVNGQSFVNETARLDNFNGAAGNGVAADFTNDGLCDIVLIAHPNVSQDQMVINNFSGAGAGQFTVVTQSYMPAEFCYGVHGEAGDMNGDGFLDLLAANWTGDPSFIRYNNNGPGSSGPGDFRYGGPEASTQFQTLGGSDERALVPGDFNNDGKLDFYFGNEGFTSGGRSDAIYVNRGNDSTNRAIFAVQPFSSNQNTETMKIDINDLDQDGRVDLVIMSEFNRPYIYRNTSGNQQVSFVEWTPPGISVVQEGWHAKSADLFGSPRSDLLIGADVNDHLFENVPSDNFERGSLTDGILPPFHDLHPISVTGQAVASDSVRFISSDLPVGAQVSVLMRSFGDTRLTVRQNGNVLASSDRIGHGVDEFVQFDVGQVGPIEFEVVVDKLSFDGNGDGVVNLLDVASFIDCLSGQGDCDAFDFNGTGEVNLLLVQPFIDRLISSNAAEEFVIEFLSRSN